VIFALVAVLANLLVDLMYAVLDPRIRYGSS
jgi:peptide/nickel transport system permease protein